MRYHPVPTIQFLIGPDKVSAETRCERGVKIGGQAPKSALYLEYADMKTSADDVVAKTGALKKAMDANAKAHAEWLATSTALESALVAWDGSYDVFTATGQKYAADENDVASLGGVARGKVHHALAMPDKVTLTYDPKKDLLRVHVFRPPGMRACVVHLTTDLSNPASWMEQPGIGAIHTIAHPIKTTWWARAACKNAKDISDFTTPVSVIVK